MRGTKPDSKFWLFDIYFFTGVATLAKGPVAPLLAIVIVCAFAFLRKEWSIVQRSVWWPGIALYFAITLPWFIAVQHQNPTFFREFFLEHNLERFATNRYQHSQPFWYYFVVVLLAVMPWTVIAVRALIDGVQTSVAEWRLRRLNPKKRAPNRPGDAFPEFLVLWAIIPIVFFSFSQSKLPGYILPSIPPITILTGDYLFRRRQAGLNRWELVGHAALCGLMTVFALLLPWFVGHGPVMPPPRAAGGGTAGVGRSGAADCGGGERLRCGTAAAGNYRSARGADVFSLRGRTVLSAFRQLASTKRAIHLLDKSYSARPLADRLALLAPPDETVAVFRVRRDVEYGLAFYRNREVVNYEDTGVPDEEHLLVARVTGRRGVDLHTPAALQEYLEGRHYEEILSWPEQGLEVYLVGAR